MYPFTKLGEWFAEDLIKRVISAVRWLHQSSYPAVSKYEDV